MDRVGISFRSPLSAEEVRREAIAPLRQAIESSQKGIYCNYLHHPVDGPVDGAAAANEHLIVFEVRDFKAGLRLLRTSAQQLQFEAEWRFHNLNPSTPLY